MKHINVPGPIESFPAQPLNQVEECHRGKGKGWGANGGEGLTLNV